MYAIPQSIKRINATAFIDGAFLARFDGVDLLMRQCEETARQAVHKISTECVQVSDDGCGGGGKMIKLDVYVLSPADMENLIAKATAAGREEMHVMMGFMK